MANLLLRGALILLLLPAVVNTESHWESYTDWAMGYIWSCYPYYYTRCSDWYSYPYYLEYNSCTCSRYQQYSSVCYQETGWNCFTNCIGWILVTRWRCQKGWQGANCDIPICNDPTCTVDQICVKPFTCDCPRSSTGECLYEPCDDGPNNCYPGFCNKTGNPWNCICPAGFTGPNCQTVTNTPEIKSCYVQIFGTPDGQREQEVARANECAAPGLDPLPVWIGQRAANQLTKIVVNWEAQYVNQVPLPGRGRAPYILDAPVPIGIVETNFAVSFPDQTRFVPQSTFCIGPDPVYDLPPTIKQCNGILKQWTDLGVSSIIKSNVSFLVTIEAEVGGVKKGDNNWVGGRFTTAQRFSMDPNMNTTTRVTKFAFDLEPPYHCLTRSNCSVFPIFLNRTLSSNPIIRPTFNGWRDDASGIDRFYVEVYYMQPDAQNLLVPTGAPLKAENVNITLNNFQFTCPNPGAYSIILTVYDKANNSAMARKIFNYDNHESSFYETASPIYLSVADSNTSYRFITRLEKPADGIASYQFNVIWDGHFANSNEEDWLRGVRPWPMSDNVIDDSYGSKFGLRSIDSLTMETGVSGYELAYSVDTLTGGVGAVAPSNFTVITDRSRTSFPISIAASLKDGDTIIVWLKVYDLYGNSVMIVSKTHVDTSRFGIVVVGDPMFAKHLPDQFTSSLVINVVSRISGIKNITYEIYDKSKQLSVRNETFFPVVLEAPSALGSRKRRDVERPCLSTDPTCYCIPLGYCYNRTQLINIDNCWIDRVAGDEIDVRFKIYSMAGWGLGGEINAGTLRPEDIPCRPPIIGMVVLTGGAIAGIVIAGLIFLLLLILLILMCVRWRFYRKHPVPIKIRNTFHNTFGRNSAPTMNIISDNELYASKGEVIPSINKKSKETRLWANKLWDAPPGKSGEKCENWIVSGKNLQIGDVITEGRFAVIRKGFLTTGNEKNAVAIKALRSGYDKGDPEVMSAKIDFMANQFKPHPNIIRFLGIVADDKQVPPVMLLELCDKTLKDWLSEITTVDAEVLEDMLSFTLHIARGVQHLHDQKIIHRRLAVRNVLLKRAIGGYEAKLIGFGPSREDAEERPNNEQSTLGLSVVPLKWMAPETLDTLNSRKPTYDEKTDTWSFGVTIWEIYSKGDAPYANHKSADIRAVLKRGERLTCPEACHPDLFNGVLYPCWNASPKKRPSFTKIGTFIEQFRNGMSSSAGGGYYAAPSVASPSGIEAPPGYYAARDALQGNNGRDNAGLYHDARSG